MEFEFNPDGRLRYANDSKYKNDVIIRKEAFVSKAVLDEVKRIVETSEIQKCALARVRAAARLWRARVLALNVRPRARSVGGLQGGRPRVARARCSW